MKIALILFLLSSNTFAASLNLLELPLSDKTTEVYSVDLKDSCSFNGVNEIILPKLEQPKENLIIDTLDNVQKKINWSIGEQTITKDKISFNLKGAENVLFEFSFSNCKLKREVTFNNKKHVMDSIDIEYDNTLSPPVVKNFILRDVGKNEIEKFSPIQLDGQISSHELVLGPVVNIHTNIRLNNQKRFDRTHPVVKPVPGFMFRYGPLFLNREGAGTLAFNKGDFTVLLMGVLKGESYEAGGMRDRKEGIFLGSTLKYNLVELIYFNDFFKDRGYNFKLNFAPSFHYLTKWKFSPQAYVQYWDNKYVDYYFGVSPGETQATGLKTYNGKHTFNYGTLFEVNHYVDKWTFLGIVGAKFYGKEVYTSPTVVKKNELRLVLGVLYKVF